MRLRKKHERLPHLRLATSERPFLVVLSSLPQPRSITNHERTACLGHETDCPSEPREAGVLSSTLTGFPFWRSSGRLGTLRSNYLLLVFMTMSTEARKEGGGK